MRGVLRSAALFGALGAAFAPGARAGDGCDSLARSLGAAAGRKSVKRVAVVPFMGPRGGSSYAGAVLAERVASRLLERGGLELIERPLLESVLQEQKLGLFGIMEPRTARALGRVLGVDAILTGTAVELRGQRVEINARLIHAETAQVLAAVTARVPKDWEEPAASEEPGSIVVPVPSLGGGDAWRDSVADGDGCRERERRLERALLDYKARYWAARLKDPSFSTKALTRNPGSEIRDPDLRKEFYELMRRRYYAESEPLTSLERETLAGGMKELAVLSESCGG